MIADRFVEMLAPPRGTPAEIVWSFAQPAGDAVLLFLGVRYPGGLLKTRWSVARTPSGWRVHDVVLTDPGISVSAEAGRSFGRGAVYLRDRVREARTVAVPRLAGIAAIVAIVVFMLRRLSPAGRRILLATAAAPTILFALDGYFAVRRALSEPYRVPEVFSPEPWRAPERKALAAQREGRLEDARAYWREAVTAGAPAAPAQFELGLAFKAAGRTAEAKEAFALALSHSSPAPGASKELGLIALAEGNSAEARDRLRRYLAEAGPDPDALSALAVASANLGEKSTAVESVEEARSLMPERWKGVRLQSQVYARAGDARKTVETLRALEADGTLDREILRSDPAYLPIATDPVWVGFLAETPTPGPTPAP